MKDVEAIDEKRDTVHFRFSKYKKTRVHQDRGANAALDHKGMMCLHHTFQDFCQDNF